MDTNQKEKFYYICKKSDYSSIINYGLKVKEFKHPNKKKLEQEFPKWDGQGIWVLPKVDTNIFRKLALYLWEKRRINFSLFSF